MILLALLSNAGAAAADEDDGGASLSAGTGGIPDTSAAVDGVGATTCARGLNTIVGYAGALNNPFGFSLFEPAVGA